MIPLGVLSQQQAGELLSKCASWLTMDESSDGSMAVTRVDSIGSNDATDNNTCASVSAVHGNGARFVKANSESLTIPAPHGLHAGGRDFWFALQYKPITITQYDGVVSCGIGAYAYQHDYVLQILGGSLAFYVPYGGTWYWAQSGVTLVADTQYHVYCQYNDTTNKCGISVNHESLVETLTGTPNNLGGDVHFGHYYGYQYGDCVIDEWAFGTTLLTTDERLEHANNAYGDL